jgi:uncharacterized membrane protein
MLTNPTIHTSKSFPWRAFLKFAGMNLGLAIVLVSLGYFPTLRMIGDQAIFSMFCGIAVTMLATLVGMVPVLMASQMAPQDRLQAIMMGMAIRLALLVLLSGSLVLSGVVIYRAMLIWVAVSFLFFLLVDTLAMYSVLKAADSPPASEESSAI